MLLRFPSRCSLPNKPSPPVGLLPSPFIPRVFPEVPLVVLSRSESSTSSSPTSFDGLPWRLLVTSFLEATFGAAGFFAISLFVEDFFFSVVVAATFGAAGFFATLPFSGAHFFSVVVAFVRAIVNNLQS